MTEHAKTKADNLAKRAREHETRNEFPAAIRLYQEAANIYREIKEYELMEVMKANIEHLEY